MLQQQTSDQQTNSIKRLQLIKNKAMNGLKSLFCSIILAITMLVVILGYYIFIKHMNQVDPESEEQYHALDEQLLNINDYSQQEPNSNPSEQQEIGDQQSPFEELEQIFEQDENAKSRNQLIYIAKIGELQDKLGRMSKTNKHLTQRIEDLQYDAMNQKQAEIDEQIVIEFIQAMEREFAQYKAQFGQYREKQHMLNKAKDQQIEQMRQSIHSFGEEKAEWEEERFNLVEMNEDLKTTNQSLILEIQNLENEVIKNRSQSQSSRGYGFGSRRNQRFEGEVQAELESLIEKLVAELQFERNHKKKMSEEIKRIQQSVMDLEREIVTKNNKIYSLEMSNLKSNRVTTKIEKGFGDRQDRTFRNKRTEVQNQKNQRTYGYNSDRSSTMKNFSVMELLNDQSDLTDRQRMIISMKIVDFYLRKLSNKDYSTFMLDGLLICNFNKINPNLLIIRKDPNAASQSDETTQERLIWNLGFVLQNIVSQSINYKEERSESEERLVELISNLTDQRNCTLNNVYDVKRQLQEMIRMR